jgi:hypothetical protein
MVPVRRHSLTAAAAHHSSKLKRHRAVVIETPRPDRALYGVLKTGPLCALTLQFFTVVLNNKGPAKPTLLEFR